MFGSEYVVDMLNDGSFRGPEGFTFEQVVWESFTVPIIKMLVANQVTFNQCWFENLTGSHLVKMQQCRIVTFNQCKWDLSYTSSGVPFSFDSSGPRVDAKDIREAGCVVINGGELKMNTSTSTSVKFAEVANSETPEIRINGASLTRGHIFSDPTVVQDVQSIALTTDDNKSFYSVANAHISRNYNSWVRGTQSADWDFSAGANFAAQSGTTGLTIATTTTDGEFLTGTTGVKVTGYTSGSGKKTITRNTGTNGDMTKVTTEGETFLFFVRLKCDQEVTLSMTVQGASLTYGGPPDHLIPADQWRDYVFKTQVDSTWAQGRQFNPQLLIGITNASGSDATLLIDRVDYKICNGDHYI